MMEELENEYGSVTRVCETLWSCVQRHMLQMKECVDRLEAEKATLQARLDQATEENNRLKEENKSFMSVSRIVALTNENAKLSDKVKFLEGVIARRPSASPPPTLMVAPSTVSNNAPCKPAVDLMAFLEKEVGVVPSVEEPIEEPVEAAEEPVEAVKEPVEVAEEPVEAVKEPVEVAEEAVEAVEESVEAVEESVEVAEESVEAVKQHQTTEDPVNDVKEEQALEEEQEEELFETTIKGKAYFMTDTGKIYECLEDGDVGEYIGDYVTGKGGKRKVVWH